MASLLAHDSGLNLKATELRLGLPGSDEDADHQEIRFSAKNNKRTLPDDVDDDDDDQLAKNKETKTYVNSTLAQDDAAPAPKEQIVGWPPVRSTRINSPKAKKVEADQSNGIFVKVSMDGAPYLRKIDLKGYKGYNELLKALEDMFNNLKFGEYSESEGYKGSEYALTYEDKDGDMMLVGDVPWEMFMSSCKRFRIMKALQVKGLSCGL